MDNISKQHKAFLRKLYLAYLIDQGEHNLPALQQLTGMPRRTLQDAIAAFGDVGIRVSFVQQGPRNNAGFYRVEDWGPIKPEWVANQVDALAALLTAS
ncbi:hypothetical protein NFHSH190041_29780 [Shewanella sp. NFH-SH190041]|uniref:winged helix-turn-helix domain-containing protein n=1 Tax=Shewanella sp. NFH-SH190041 TaxID=2950245 RepID=UPI0021C4522B|nr:winged helix-turn-helix domain-containing protein [Shewanella sp. NFH-SH190041]BDM65526.1 hypothetical protein NFHSH190041_29780 [Shewanella sp. NFH-SH190041]